MEIGKIDACSNIIATVTAPALSPQERAEQRQLIQAVKAVNEMQFFGPSSELQLSYDRNARRPIMKVVDLQTKEVVQQIPPEYVLRLAEEASEK